MTEFHIITMTVKPTLQKHTATEAGLPLMRCTAAASTHSQHLTSCCCSSSSSCVRATPGTGSNPPTATLVAAPAPNTTIKNQKPLPLAAGSNNVVTCYKYMPHAPTVWLRPGRPRPPPAAPRCCPATPQPVAAPQLLLQLQQTRRHRQRRQQQRHGTARLQMLTGAPARLACW
jgi:hypothetical protein